MQKILFKDIEEVKTAVGKELPLSKWITVTQVMINDFANATLDKQWIHIDQERAAKESPFKTTIAHGFMSLSLISKLLEEIVVIENSAMGLNYGLNKVRFMNPVPVNSRLRLHASIKDVEDYKKGIKITFLCTIEIEHQEKPSCVAEFITLLFE